MFYITFYHKEVLMKNEAKKSKPAEKNSIIYKTMLVFK